MTWNGNLGVSIMYTGLMEVSSVRFPRQCCKVFRSLKTLVWHISINLWPLLPIMCHSLCIILCLLTIVTSCHIWLNQSLRNLVCSICRKEMYFLTQHFSTSELGYSATNTIKHALFLKYFSFFSLKGQCSLLTCISW